jgi:hypothetical protein
MRSRDVVGAALIACAACAPPAPRPVAAPAPQPVIAPPPSAEPLALPLALPLELPPSAPVVASGEPVDPEPEMPSEPAIDPGPTPSTVMETPYKMGQRAEPKTREAYREDILERRHWNKGGTGTLIGELPGPEGHPDPRVTVTIEKANGPHQPAELQRVARQYHWINVVRCYRLGHHKDPFLRGWTKAVVTVSKSGKVQRPRLLSTELKEKPVADCMTDKLKTLAFPAASAGSRAWVDMKVSPGDDPSPPPDELIVPGDGEMPIEEMQKGVEAGMPAFEACYRAAFAYAPELWGRILMRYHVNEHGTLKGVYEWGSYFPDKRVSQCILRHARRLTFPRPSAGEIRFFVPLRLSSDRSAHAQRVGE